jgi:hypothetical protein
MSPTSKWLNPVRAAALALLCALPTAQASAADTTTPAFFVSGGVGFVELVHLEAGVYLGPTLSVELHYGNQIFNNLVGAGVTWSKGKVQNDQPPRHAFLLHGEALVNPVGGISLSSGGERLGSELGTYVGYGFVGEHGLLFRALAGGFFYVEDGGAAFGPNMTLSVGKAF